MSESLEEPLFYFNFCSLEGNGFYHVVFVSAVQQRERPCGGLAAFPRACPARSGELSPCAALCCPRPGCSARWVHSQGHSLLPHPLLPSPRVQTSVSISVSLEEILNKCLDSDGGRSSVCWGDFLLFALNISQK